MELSNLLNSLQNILLKKLINDHTDHLLLFEFLIKIEFYITEIQLNLIPRGNPVLGHVLIGHCVTGSPRTLYKPK